MIAALEKAGFSQVRQRGSHVRMRHDDGRVLRDADLSIEHFLRLHRG